MKPLVELPLKLPLNAAKLRVYGRVRRRIMRSKYRWIKWRRNW